MLSWVFCCLVSSLITSFFVYLVIHEFLFYIFKKAPLIEQDCCTLQKQMEKMQLYFINQVPFIHQNIIFLPSLFFSPHNCFVSSPDFMGFGLSIANKCSLFLFGFLQVNLVVFILGLRAACSSGMYLCPWQGVGVKWSSRSLLAQAVLWLFFSLQEWPQCPVSIGSSACC